MTAAERHMAWLYALLIPVAGRTCRYLWVVRAAIPLPVRLILGAALVIKCCPLDFGTDELLTALAVLLLRRMRPGLVRTCWQAARIRA